jgi:hypothetical protein
LGRIDERRAIVIAQGTACLDIDARTEVDVELCANPEVLAGVSVKELAGRVRAKAVELDPATVAERHARAARTSGVWTRPAPDGQCYLTARMPLVEAVSCFAAIKRAADAIHGTMNGLDAEALRAAGIDPASVDESWRGPKPSPDEIVAAGAVLSRGQLMTRILRARLTGQGDSVNPKNPVTINLTVSDAALFGAGHEPATVSDDAGEGFGQVPAQVARNLVALGLDDGAVWLRRIYSNPEGELVALSSRRRFFAGGLADALRVTSQGICSTPYCGAPAKHLDHITPHSKGGATDISNGQPLCIYCNEVKELPGWGFAIQGRSGPHRRRRRSPFAVVNPQGTESGSPDRQTPGVDKGGRQSKRIVAITPTGKASQSPIRILPKPAVVLRT